jgi:hypothetical protein
MHRHHRAVVRHLVVSSMIFLEYSCYTHFLSGVDILLWTLYKQPCQVCQNLTGFGLQIPVV